MKKARRKTAKKKTVRRSSSKKKSTRKRSTKRRKARFELRDLLAIGLTLVVFGIGISYGLDVQEDIKDDFVTDTAGW